MKKSALLLALATVMSFVLAAIPLEVSWTEGPVDRKVGTAWKALQPGDALDSAESIRLGSNAYIELKAGQRKLVISAAGLYVPDSLLKAGADGSTKKNAVLDKLSKAVAPQKAEASAAVGGVRAAEAPSTTVEWADESEDARALVTEAQGDVAEGRYEEAAGKFSEAAEALDGGERAGALYGKAFCLAVVGETIPAIKELRSLPSSGDWAGPRALLLARLDLDTGAAAEARSVLEAAISGKLFTGEDLEAAKARLAEAGSAR
jgi:hypothetical protein